MTTVASIQPLFPEDRVLDGLTEGAGQLISECQKLARLDDKPLTAALIPMLRNMNSYYTNKIEGQHTTPARIEAALKKEYQTDTGERQKQLLATAHIEAETTLEQQWQSVPVQALFSAEKVREIHANLFSTLPDQFRVTQDGEQIIPGELRTHDVTVGRHQAPEVAMIGNLLGAWEMRYGRERFKERQLIAIACSHHRLAWIHPFIDGNGRVSRLHSHLALHAAGMTRGVWSPLRGLARTHQTYYELLAKADLGRRNDLDGRGNLSQEELVRFADYFIVECCLDQVTYMTQMTDLRGFGNRLAELLRYLENNPWQIGSERSVVKAGLAAIPMEFVAANRPLTRGEFAQLLHTSDTTARRIIRSLLDFGLLKSASHRDELSFALPLASLRILFPKLWPEADEAQLHEEKESLSIHPAPVPAGTGPQPGRYDNGFAMPDENGEPACLRAFVRSDISSRLPAHCKPMPTEVIERFTRPDAWSKQLVGPMRDDSSTSSTSRGRMRSITEALERIGVLYKTEEVIRGKPPDERRAYRQLHAKPLLDQLLAWLSEMLATLSRKSDTSRAILYALNRWEALTRYCYDGQLEIDNLPVERALRGVAIGRRNYCSPARTQVASVLPRSTA